MSYLYTPPTWRNVVQLERSLRCGVPTCTLVYRQAGVWHNIHTPGMDNPVVKSVDVDASGLVLYFDRPTVVPASLYTEMSTNALTPADSSWSPGTLVPA